MAHKNEKAVANGISNSLTASFRKSSEKKDDKYYNNAKPIDTEWKEMSFIQKARHMITFITVEPILACYVMPSVLSALATQNLYLEKACRVNLGFEHHICDALTRRETANYTYYEEEVQKLVASVAGWKTVLQSFLPCGILIFIGAYSDRVGQRKFCMLLPIIGEFLTSIGLMVNTYFFDELPVEVAAVTEAIFPALTGGWFTMFMGVFSYIADITTEDQRTLRIGVVNLFYSLGVPVGAALSGILVRKIGLYGVFALSASLYILSFLYGYWRIKEVKKPVSDVVIASNWCQWLREFFDTRYVKETILVAFKKGPQQRRLRVIMLVIVLCVVIGPIYGEMSVMYLFTRYRFNWNEVDFSVFSTYAMCTSLIGTLFSVGIFSQVLKYDDAIIGVISCTSKILSGFMYAFAVTTWQIYIAPIIEIFNGTSFIAMRSMVSKLVDKEELGKVNSLFGVAEAMMPLVYAPMYTTIYGATIKSFPGAFFLLGGGLTVPAVLIFIWLYMVGKREDKKVAVTKDTDKEKGGEKQDWKTKNGVTNKAFEVDEKTERNFEKIIDNANDDNRDSQIEIGFTESMFTTSKL